MDADRPYRTLDEVHKNLATPIAMSLEQVKEFLHFHSKHRSLIFCDDGSMESLVITDLQFLINIFKKIITMWQERNTSDLTLETEKRLQREFNKGVLSGGSLLNLWSNLRIPYLENIVSIMVNFYQFIPCKKQAIPCHNQSEELIFLSKKFIVPALLPPEETEDEDTGDNADEDVNSFKKKDGTKTLIYLFHQSPDKEDITSTGFLPTGFMTMLVASLMGETQHGKGWELVKMFFSAATFITVTHGEIFVKMSSSGSAIRLKVLVLNVPASENDDCEISRVRNLFECEIIQLLLKYYPNLCCSVCVSPCQRSHKVSQANYSCLQVLGRIGCIGDKPLRELVCFDHKKHVARAMYECWFCIEQKQRTYHNTATKPDQRILNHVAKNIRDFATLRDVGVNLGVDLNDIDRTFHDSNNQIKEAALSMLYRDWYCAIEGSLERVAPKYKQLKQALNAAGLKGLLR